MTNRFTDIIEKSPVKAVASYTLLIAGSTWAISTFILDENRIASQRAISEQYKEKVSILQTEVAELQDRAQLYLSWLQDEPKSFPALERQIRQLREELSNCPKRTAPTGVEPVSRLPSATELSEVILKRGDTFVDAQTGFTLGVSEITPTSEASGTVTEPGRASTSFEKKRPGSTWSFQKKGKNYTAILKRVFWLNDTFSVVVIEK